MRVARVTNLTNLKKCSWNFYQSRHSSKMTSRFSIKVSFHLPFSQSQSLYVPIPFSFPPVFLSFFLSSVFSPNHSDVKLCPLKIETKKVSYHALSKTQNQYSVCTTNVGKQAGWQAGKNTPEARNREQQDYRHPRNDVAVQTKSSQKGRDRVL